MSFRTGYRFNFRLKSTTPHEVLEILRDMMSSEEPTTVSFPEHPFFGSTWVLYMLSNGSAYFEFDGEMNQRALKIDIDTGEYEVTAFGSSTCREKDAGLFLDWLKPWISTDERVLLGVARHEERGYLDAEHIQFYLDEDHIRQCIGKYCVTEVEWDYKPLDSSVVLKPISEI